MAEAVLPPRWAEWEGFWRTEAANTGPVVGWHVAGADPHPLPALLPGKRTKKGMATAKQRLGKILKIHRNGKLLL